MRSVGALGGTAGAGGGRFEELAVEVVAGCGLQLPQASSSESSTAMVGTTARAEAAACDTALGGVTGCCVLPAGQAARGPALKPWCLTDA